MKLKQNTKLKSYGKCDVLRKRFRIEEVSVAQNKISYREYMNEIFAGLMWLG